MTNIFHEIKRGFLILGFTGPLSSGCTTAANFFENEINEFISENYDKSLPKIEKKLKKICQSISSSRSSLEKISNPYERSKIYKRLNSQARKAKEYLYFRETLSILKEYEHIKFKYISMTDMLLKLVIENQDTFKDKDREHIKKLLDLIDYDSVKLKSALDISKKIKERKIYSLGDGDISLYEDYLTYITSFKKSLKKAFDPNILGVMLQDFGDNVRRCGNPLDYDTKFSKDNLKTLFIIAEEANNVIKFFRNKRRSLFGKEVFNEFVIEAFRNPYEVEYFRNRYYEFFLFSIYAPIELRSKRSNFNLDREKRDRGVGLLPNEFYKQNVTECVYLSDIAINNDSEKKKDLRRKLSKYFALICQPGCIPPTSDELFMHLAYSMSVMSNCICRQVGAIIVGERGYIVGAGWNDVGAGQIPCGLRRYSDIQDDPSRFVVCPSNEYNEFRDFLITQANGFLDHSFCFKDNYARYKTKKRIESLYHEDTIFKQLVTTDKITKEQHGAINDFLTEHFSAKKLEYCRALHAEENAILQNTIIGGTGIEGGTIYTTTFPCELCAKKIYQARLKKVVFIEPYPESISEEVFFKDGSHYITLVQFEGVKSYSYFRLFKSPVDKKEFQIQEKIL